MRNGQIEISWGQLSLLLITLVGSTALLFAPTMSIGAVKQDAWISLSIIATVYALAVIWITTKLALRFERMTFGQYTKLILGNWLFRLVGVLYLAYIIIILLVIAREFGGFLSAAFMSETPMVVFIFTLLVLAAFAAVGGLEVIARMNQFLLPLAIISLTLTFVFTLTDVDPLNLLPFFDHKPIELLEASIVPAAFRGEVFVLLWLVCCLKKPRDGFKAGAVAVIFLGVTLAIDAILVVGVMGQELATKLTFPTLVLIRYARMGMVLNRVEGLVMALWVAGVIVKSSVFLLIALITMKETFSWKRNSWYLMLPLILFLIPGALYIFKSDEQVVWFLEKVITGLSLVFQLILPTILLLTALARKKGVKT
ncbi:MAG: endospore germination permease [Bacillota bacterium]